MKKRAYSPPAVSRVDLVSHEVALQVCKTNVKQSQPNGAFTRCTTGGNPCRNVNSPS